jgi:hypothetical protein
VLIAACIESIFNGEAKCQDDFIIRQFKRITIKILYSLVNLEFHDYSLERGDCFPKEHRDDVAKTSWFDGLIIGLRGNNGCGLDILNGRGDNDLPDMLIDHFQLLCISQI